MAIFLPLSRYRKPWAAKALYRLSHSTGVREWDRVSRSEQHHI